MSKREHGSINDGDLSRLMERAQAGHREDYVVLLKTCEKLLSSSVRNAFRRLGLSGDEVPDVVQEILCAIHDKRATYDPRQPFLPWMFAIAHYKTVDHFRRRHAAGRRFEPLAEQDVADEAENEDAKLDWLELSKRLSDKQRNVIQLVKIEGRSVEEASQMTGYSASDIKITVHRALKALMEWVKEKKE